MSISLLSNPENLTIDFLHIIASTEDYDLKFISPMVSKIHSTAIDTVYKISRLLNHQDYIPVISQNKRKLYKKFNRYNYTDLAEIIVYRPIGLTSTYYRLVTVLEAVQSDVLQINERILIPFLKWSGEVLNNPQKLQRITVNKHFEFINVENFNKTMDKLFDQNDTRDTVKYGEVFESNSQLISLLDTYNEVIERQNKLPAKDLMKTVDDAAKRTQMLTQRCQDVEISELCSNASKKVMADVLYQIAQEITLYSRLSYLIISSRNALNDSISKILSLS